MFQRIKTWWTNWKLEQVRLAELRKAERARRRAQEAQRAAERAVLDGKIYRAIYKTGAIGEAVREWLHVRNDGTVDLERHGPRERIYAGHIEAWRVHGGYAVVRVHRGEKQYCSDRCMYDQFYIVELASEQVLTHGWVGRVVDWNSRLDGSKLRLTIWHTYNPRWRGDCVCWSFDTSSAYSHLSIDHEESREVWNALCG